MGETRAIRTSARRRWATLFACALALTPLALRAPKAQAAEAERIGVSYQPSVYWALPFYIATQKGWWKQVDLDPSFAVFPAGAPQVAAAQAGSWDVGGTGSVPGSTVISCGCVVGFTEPAG